MAFYFYYFLIIRTYIIELKSGGAWL
jgi:hypothetical protein